jgi:SHS2 domain-containing protein
MPYEYLDHQADLGIRGIGGTPEEALSQGAQAMLAAMADVEKVGCEQEWVQRCTAPDIPSLFVEWLNELLYQREVHDFLFASARVTRLERSEQGWFLEGVACGEPLDESRHQVYTEIKAATYSGLDYRREGDRYVVQCVVDL